MALFVVVSTSFIALCWSVALVSLMAQLVVVRSPKYVPFRVAPCLAWLCLRPRRGGATLVACNQVVVFDRFPASGFLFQLVFLVSALCFPSTAVFIVFLFLRRYVPVPASLCFLLKLYGNMCYVVVVALLLFLPRAQVLRLYIYIYIYIIFYIYIYIYLFIVASHYFIYSYIYIHIYMIHN